jgi:hypothetical protein
MPLQYTPRKFVIHPETGNIILIETDHNAYTEDTKQQRKQQMAEVWIGVKQILLLVMFVMFEFENDASCFSGFCDETFLLIHAHC